MKAVIFDFDGTLSQKSTNMWKALWTRLGYDISRDSYFAQIYGYFLVNKISHQQWCDLTCDSFKNANMHKDILHEISKGTHLIDGCSEALNAISKSNINLHILSGGIKQVIETTLGNDAALFDSINANQMQFDHNGKLEKIIGTKYDFEGKLQFVNEYTEQHNISPQEICFVGNGQNDEWVAKSGCKTICINPDDTNASDKSAWTTSLFDVDNLTDILPEIQA